MPTRPPGPRTLVFDTSGPHCAAGIGVDGVVLHETTEPMTRGQAERLLPLLEEILVRDGSTWADIAALGVGVGPGNFTGIRIAVAAARGLALGLGIPAIPVTAFDLARDVPDPGAGAAEAELVLVAAPRSAAYAQLFRYGRPSGPPEVIDPAAPPEHFRGMGLEITGHRAEDAAGALGAAARAAADGDIPRRMARIVAWKRRAGIDAGLRPAPLYVRSPDAAPPADPPPVILR